MTFAELRLCVRWRRRDSRYKLRGDVLALTLDDMRAARAWRLDEAETIGSPTLIARARSWEP